MEAILRFLRLSKSHWVQVDNKTYQTYWCQACGAIVADKLNHARFIHNAGQIEVTNELAIKGSLKDSRKRIKEAGKKIHIIGGGKDERSDKTASRR